MIKAVKDDVLEKLKMKRISLDKLSAPQPKAQAVKESENPN